jgi:hypothetical protein
MSASSSEVAVVEPADDEPLPAGSAATTTNAAFPVVMVEVEASLKPLDLDYSRVRNIRSGYKIKDPDGGTTIHSFAIGWSVVAVGVFAIWLYQMHASGIPLHPSAAGLDVAHDAAGYARVQMEGLWGSYRTVLSDSPIATKAATSASVYAIGDVLSQRTEGATTFDGIDKSRTLRSLLAGLIGHGPLSHFWYIYLDNFFTDVLHMTEWWAFLPKILFDQTTVGIQGRGRNRAVAEGKRGRLRSMILTRSLAPFCPDLLFSGSGPPSGTIRTSSSSAS